jgi:CheY-like chemotaxis protein
LLALKQAMVEPHVRIAWNGIDALALIFGMGNPYDAIPVVRPKLIVLDLNLPKANGLEILERLKTNPHTRAIPVVVMSASGRKEDYAESYKSGANSCLLKPTNFDKLVELVRMIAQYWLQFNQH